MTDMIATKLDIRDKARRAARAGKTLDDNPFNWHAPAHLDWKVAFLQEQDVMVQEQQQGQSE